MSKIASFSRIEYDLVIYTIAEWTVFKICEQTEFKLKTFEFEWIDERKNLSALFRRLECQSSFRIESDSYSFNVDGIGQAMR